jgi:hypothetical protein
MPHQSLGRTEMAYFEMGIPVGIPTICEGGFRISRIISFTRQDCLVLRGLELELIQTQMTQKPMLRAEVYARALRASQNRKEDSL